MVAEQHAKIAARHLTRSAYLYVRQSSLRQVFENTESTERQYALQQRALALGWPQEQIGFCRKQHRISLFDTLSDTI